MNKQKIVPATAALIAVLLACFPMFFKSFPQDWSHHVWMINYQARYYIHHLCFSPVLNAYEVIGIPFPIFYGYLFFPSMALLSTVFDGNVTVRITAFTVLLSEFALIYSCLKTFTRDTLFAIAVAAAFVWSIYPLTNLYHRAAVPEFFATAILACACVTWVRALAASSGKDLAIWCNLSILLVCATAGTHPITTLYGLPFFAVLALVALIATKPTASRVGKIVTASALPLVLLLTCIAPWAVATRKYNHQFRITETFGGVAIFPKTIDNLALRLTPAPVPYKILEHDALIEHMDTKHLDAPVNVALICALVAIVYALIKRTRLNAAVVLCLSIAIASAFGFTFLSMSPMLNKLGHAARGIQFAYRLVTYINLSLLGAILISALHIYNQTRTDESCEDAKQTLVHARLSLTIILVAAAGLIGKLISTSELPSMLPPTMDQQFLAAARTDADVMHMPKKFFAYDYSMPSMLQCYPHDRLDEAGTLKFDLAQGPRFGEVLPAHINKPAPLLTTNVEVFVWNQILCDGSPISPADCANNRFFTTLCNEHGNEFEYRFRPPDAWLIAFRLAYPAFLLWAAVTTILTVQWLRSPKGDLLQNKD